MKACNDRCEFAAEAHTQYFQEVASFGGHMPTGRCLRAVGPSGHQHAPLQDSLHDEVTINLRAFHNNVKGRQEWTPYMRVLERAAASACGCVVDLSRKTMDNIHVFVGC